MKRRGVGQGKGHLGPSKQQSSNTQDVAERQAVMHGLDATTQTVWMACSALARGLERCPAEVCLLRPRGKRDVAKRATARLAQLVVAGPETSASSTVYMVCRHEAVTSHNHNSRAGRTTARRADGYPERGSRRHLGRPFGVRMTTLVIDRHTGVPSDRVCLPSNWGTTCWGSGGTLSFGGQSPSSSPWCRYALFGFPFSQRTRVSPCPSGACDATHLL